jgi:serine/threonine-protein kinase
VLEGLAAAHGVGVVHRDLKPENLLIDRYRRWRVADFGIANALGEWAAGNSGTPAFAPAEQLLGEAQGPPADVYGLAAIVYTVLSGRAPYPGDGPAVLAAQLAGPPPLDEFLPPVAEWLRTALAADADRRFPDAQAALIAWRRVRASAERTERRERWWRRATRVFTGAQHPRR